VVTREIRQLAHKQAHPLTSVRSEEEGGGCRKSEAPIRAGVRRTGVGPRQVVEFMAQFRKKEALYRLRTPILVLKLKRACKLPLKNEDREMRRWGDNNTLDIAYVLVYAYY
jgi:hypothetical protein